MGQLFEAHRPLLEKAITACRTREYWSAFSEVPRTYGEDAAAEGKKAFESLLHQPFMTGQISESYVGDEISPYGPALGILYPAMSADALISASTKAGREWAKASIEERVGVAIEILARLNKASFQIAHAVEHTTGQAFAMAFQAGGPHAQDRGLEAVAYAYEAMTETPREATWVKPAGRSNICLDKQYRIIPRGIALVIGCATFPTWNSYPALFANLVTGNPVIVKPHPSAILPLAISVQIGRSVLEEQGFDPNVLLLAPDNAAAPITVGLAVRDEIKIVDFTGSSTFGGWLRENLRCKILFTEEAGVNTIVIGSTSTFAAMCQNIAFSLALYSGQMCTSPQAIFVPKTGIDTEVGHKSFDEVGAAIAEAIDALLADPARAIAVAGAIQNQATIARVADARKLGRILRDSQTLSASDARTATPLLIEVDALNEDAYLEERFGPISFIVKSDSVEDGITRAAEAARTKGAITGAIYSMQNAEIDFAADAFAAAGVPLSVNLTGGIYVNQSAAFSDFHVTGANPAGNACLTDTAFVANRFRVACIRRPAAA